MIVNSNPTAKLTQRYLHRATSSHADSMKKLASGSRINSAKDDAAGLQISNRLQAQLSGFDVASQNSFNAISMLQVAEGASKEYTEIAMHMRDLTLQYLNGANSDDDRDAISVEFNDLREELVRIAETTNFGGQRLLNGKAGTKSFQIGAGAGQAVQVNFADLSSILETQVKKDGGYVRRLVEYYNYDPEWRSKPGDQLVFYRDPLISHYFRDDTIRLDLKEGSSMPEVTSQMNAEWGDVLHAYIDDEKSPGVPKLAVYGIKPDERWLHYSRFTWDGGGWYGRGFREVEIGGSTETEQLSLDDTPSAEITLDRIDKLLQHVDSFRSKLGAAQNRLSHAINNLSQTSENVAASNSRIRDTDFARETSRLAKESILKEANTAMLAQASKAPQEALSLLK